MDTRSPLNRLGGKKRSMKNVYSNERSVRGNNNATNGENTNKKNNSLQQSKRETRGSLRSKANMNAAANVLAGIAGRTETEMTRNERRGTLRSHPTSTTVGNKNTGLNDGKMSFLEDAALLASYTRNFAQISNKRFLRQLKNVNDQISERMKRFLDLWYGFDTFHDLVDGDRAEFLKKLVIKSNPALSDIDNLSKFMFNDTYKLRYMINEHLKDHEKALRNQKTNITPSGAIESLTIKSTKVLKNPSIGYLKKTLLSNLVSQMRHITTNTYELKSVVCDRNTLNEILKKHNITLLIDAVKNKFVYNTVINEKVNSNFIASSPAQLSNSATTNTNYRHIFMNNVPTNNTNSFTLAKKYGKTNFNKVKWYKQCVDVQLHHEFINYCGVIDSKIKYIFIQINPLKYDKRFLKIKNMIIYPDSGSKYPDYDKNTKTLHIFGSQGISLSSVNNLLKDELEGQNLSSNKSKIFGWLVTDIKRSQDSTQVSYINEYNQKKLNEKKKLYLITQDILCACRCILSQVGCILENKGRYFIFSNDIGDGMKVEVMISKPKNNTVINSTILNDNGTNKMIVVLNNRGNSNQNTQMMNARKSGNKVSGSGGPNRPKRTSTRRTPYARL